MDPTPPPGSYEPARVAKRSMTPRDARAQKQFAREYAEQKVLTRAALLGRCA
jgi:hypothetical protein